MKRPFHNLLILFLILREIPTHALTVDFQGKRPPLNLTEQIYEGTTYLAVADLITIFGSEKNIFWEPYKLKMLITLNNIRITFTIGNPFVLVGDSTLHFKDPPLFLNHQLYFPIIYMETLLKNVLPEKIQWEPQKNTLTIASDRSSVSDIQIEEKTNGTMLTMTLSDKIAYQTSYYKPYFLITLNQGKIPPSLFNTGLKKGLIRGVECIQFETAAQVSLLLEPRASEPKLIERSDPYQLIVTVRPRVAADTTKSSDKINDKDYIKNEKLKEINTIVIDPGHGGKDPGAIGYSKQTFEKDCVLEIALQLEQLILTKSKIKVLLTRREDQFMQLNDRTDYANKSGADLFISLHANSISGNTKRIKQLGGYLVYFLAPAKNDEARIDAAKENAVIELEREKSEQPQQEEFDMRNFILLDLLMNEFHHESQDFAGMISNEFSKIHSLRQQRTGVDQAGFYVLNGGLMPAVLIEIAYISNPEDERLLFSKKFQKEVAESILNGILNFKSKYEVKYE